ncbi:NADPH oxidoreductase, putative flavodoxin quinone reductase FqrB [Campylobacter blaseri]|uniref:Cbb3-type cytochrome oxidase assembly protein CcoS n=1 Tax=Campylobacter blaseri TaxID=2042961 RepID=A0A2P8QYF2_9BACT|nr:NAD(P)-binding domain-containing protein [Campylobacter blaseri]PSM51279.1 cbb3-type cytochrome oxidase assembly protein CcoS [Campylobacter blaseri]PSM52423.1 cbb3-type cytochrome oxidase assembly protein CcoS [Campylobacter blaseri]QKF86248.1 NADPH oxidoreductase, putative flavodoxin quinone reductase FqrB [Campylobacter blaseri]
MDSVYDIAIIGGGPCGIASAVEAKISGIENILLLEKGDNHSQTIRTFYKDNKRVDKEYKGLDSQTKGRVEFETGSKEDVLNYFDALLDNETIDAIFETEVEKIVKNSDGNFEIFTAHKHYFAKNVIVAVGRMGRPNKPSYKIPPSITQRVNFNLDKCSTGEKILVVGGGNSAVEYAMTLSRENIVTLSYRKGEFTRINEINAKNLAYDVKYGNIILRLKTDIESIENEEGKVLVNYKDGRVFVYDRVIYAIGGTTPVDFLKSSDIEVDEKKIPIIDENCETNIKGLYVGGDLATRSGASIVVALNHSNTIIEHINSKNR